MPKIICDLPRKLLQLTGYALEHVDINLFKMKYFLGIKIYE